MVRKNRITGNTGDGVFIPDNGRGTIEDNDITANTNHGVSIYSGADPVDSKEPDHRQWPGAACPSPSTVGAPSRTTTSPPDSQDGVSMNKRG